VAEGVSAEVLEAEVADDLVPVSGVAEYCGADPAAPPSGEQAGIGSALCGIDALLDEFTDVDDQGHEANITGADMTIDGGMINTVRSREACSQPMQDPG
jgi:hypothetical protein